MRVLVVEDDAAVGELLQNLLRDLGHETELVPSAEAALQRPHVSRPDLIFLDLRLPGLSGLDFLQLRPARDSRIPTLVLSAVATARAPPMRLQLGALDLVPKT